MASETYVDDADRDDSAYYHSKIIRTALGMFITNGGTTAIEKAVARGLKIRLDGKVTEFGGSTWRGDVFADAAADRDHRFAEAVRKLCDDSPASKRFATSFFARLDDVHLNIYGTPCTAKEEK